MGRVGRQSDIARERSAERASRSASDDEKMDVGLSVSFGKRDSRCIRLSMARLR